MAVMAKWYMLAKIKSFQKIFGRRKYNINCPGDIKFILGTDDIKKAFVKNMKLRGVGSDDQFGQVVLQLQGFTDGLEEIRETISGFSKLV